jgi:hypothetical protein
MPPPSARRTRCTSQNFVTSVTLVTLRLLYSSRLYPLTARIHAQTLETAVINNISVKLLLIIFASFLYFAIEATAAISTA